MGEAPASRKKSDLRRSARFQLEDAVTLVYKKTLLSALGIGRTNEARAAVNLSEGGILVRTHDRVKNGTKVRIRLEIEKFKDVIEAEGVVRWCFQGAGEGSDYYAGIRFTHVPEQAAAKISRLRGYFTSPEYRSRSAARRRQDPLGLET
jgi:Tfp pilus assembly protein PilZ